MKNLTLVFSLMIGLFMLSSQSKAIEIQEIKTSGITAWLVEDHSIPLMAMKFSFEGGAATDPADKTGLSQFLSGMMDEGAGDMTSTQFQQEKNDNSIRLSFSASRHRFDGSLQTLTVNRAKAFSLLKLALTAARFDKEPLERIRQQNLVSIKYDEEKPRVIASRAWLKSMVGNHPYARPTGGTIAGIKAITADDLRAKAKQVFTKDGLLIAVTGDIDAKTLKKLIDDVFGGLPSTSDLKPVPAAKVMVTPKLQIIDRDIPQSVIVFGQKGILRKDPDFVPAYVLFQIFGSGDFSSRLMEEVREKRGLAYSAYATLYPFRRAGLILGSTATVNKRVGETIEVLRNEFKRMAEKGPTEKELKNAISYLTGAYALRFDTNSKIAGQLMGNMKNKLGIDYVKNRNDIVRAVTLKDIRRVAKRILHADQLVFTIVGKPEGLQK
jgi:zinc protease